MNITIRRLVAHLALTAGACLAGLAMAAGPAAAQVDPSYHDVMQQDVRGQWVVRGQIYVPDKLDRNNYVEHWVLFPGYVYPSATNRVEMKVVPAEKKFAHEAEFFAQSFPQGSRYVRVLAQESDIVPSTDLPRLGNVLPGTKAATTTVPQAGGWAWVLGGVGIALSLLDSRRRSRR